MEFELGWRKNNGQTITRLNFEPPQGHAARADAELEMSSAASQYADIKPGLQRSAHRQSESMRIRDKYVGPLSRI